MCVDDLNEINQIGYPLYIYIGHLV